jgi:hypothetical protein
MKKIYSILSLLIFTLIFLYFFVTCSETSKNVTNAKKIKIGATRNHLIQVMGKPKWEGQLEHNMDTLKTILLVYEPPFGSSEGIDFYIDIKSDTVVKITLSDVD